MRIPDVLARPWQPMSRKLPLLISSLLGAVLLLFGIVAQQRLESTLSNLARARLANVSEPLTAMLDGSARSLRASVERLAVDPALAAHLALGTPGTASAARAVLESQLNSTSTSTGRRVLWSRDCRIALAPGTAAAPPASSLCRSLAAGTAGTAADPAAAGRVGPYFVDSGAVLFEIGAPVRDAAGRTLGYLIEVRRVSQAESVDRLGNMIGTRATLMVGNTSPALWTNLSRAVQGPPADVARGRLVEYDDHAGERQLGIAQNVAGTPWAVWVQMPVEDVMAPAHRLLRDLAAIALVCLLLGAVGAWAVSRQVTVPLAEVAGAAGALAAGEYSRRVPVLRNDELGQLSLAFNSMAIEIERSSVELQSIAREAEERYREAAELATELELSNQELLESLDATSLARRETAAARSLFENVLTTAPLGIAILDPELRYVQVNTALAEMNGVPAEAHIGRRIDEVVPAIAGTVETELREVLRTGASFSNRKLSAPGVAGAPSHWRMSAVPVRGANGWITGVACIVVDTTAQDELQDQLLQVQKMEAIGQLAGGVAHDFNNILTVILSYSTLALEALPEGAEMRGDVEEIRAAAQRAADLTRQLLAFSRKQVMQPKVLDLNLILRDMDRMLRPLLGEDITMVSRLAPDVGAIFADPGQLEQVVMNLAMNARDAMPTGGTLTIETTNVNLSSELSIGAMGASAGEYVVLRVSDTGIGMTEETQSRLFEPFFTTKPAGQGTGLGLATVYGIVKQSGGDIHVHSTPGVGTTFTIYVPRHHAGDAASAGPDGAAFARFGGSETILLVEDDEALRDLARRVLVRAGYNVLHAGVPAQAVRIGLEHDGRIDLLLADVVMPEMNGREVCERLSGRRPDMRVLYMSGYNDDAVVRRGIIASETSFLQKPFTPEELTRRVRAVLDGRRGTPAGSLPGAPGAPGALAPTSRT